MEGMPPELMQLLGGGAAGGAPGAAPGAAPGGPMAAGPGGSPMTTPQSSEGEKQNAMVNVNLAMDLLEQTLGPLGSESEEGQTVVQVLSVLGKKFGHTKKKSQDLIPAELMQLMQSLPQQGGMSPEHKAMGGQPAMPGAMPH